MVIENILAQFPYELLDIYDSIFRNRAKVFKHHQSLSTAYKYVCISGSTPGARTLGVPQGRILGP